MNSSESESMEDNQKTKERYLKILNSRSMREKALMIGNHILAERKGRGFLTQDEVNSLAEAKTEKQEKEYRQYRELFTRLDKHLPIIKHGLYVYLSSLHRVDALLLIIQKNEALEKIINTILPHITDVKEREKVISQLETNDHPYSKSHGVLSFISPSHYTDEKDLRAVVHHTEPLEQYLENAQKSLSDLKALIESFWDTMKERRFPLTDFISETDSIGRWINNDKSELMILKAYKPNTSYNQEITEPNYKTIPTNQILYDNCRRSLEVMFNE
jgi:hypothetical protein